ncbi:hypothetical protein GCM10025862_29050 [Arsenicicoccus piscis]|uniref:Molecular chaperone DnaK n=2 Tax=Arsenicicoccus piscis TaxID=673954 RepID=A0ABQ6HTN2_9MICO|nr:hypothetical protein GCM10025862_29050 [Arsenicicoccus piscis]
MPKIEVTFDIDANGIVHVSAKDQGTGKEQSMTISGGSALSKDEIDRMVKDAEAHADEDKARREQAESRNNAEQLVYSTEKFLAENGDKVADGRGPVDEALKDLKETLANAEAPAEDVSAKATTLSEESQKLGAALYAKQSEEANAAGAAGGDAGTGAGAGEQAQADDDVVDAEVVDDEDDKKTK